MSTTLKNLVDAAAPAAGVTKKLATAVLEAAFEKAAADIKSGTEVTIRDFGRFYQKERAARVARNPKTGETVQVPAKVVTKFAPRGILKA